MSVKIVQWTNLKRLDLDAGKSLERLFSGNDISDLFLSWSYSSVGEHCLDMAGVTSSILVTTTIIHPKFPDLLD